MSDHVLPPEGGTLDADHNPPSSPTPGPHPQIELPDLVVHRPRHLTLVPSYPSAVDETVVAAGDDVPLADSNRDSAIVRLCALFGAATPEDALPRVEELLRLVKLRGPSAKGATDMSEWGTWDDW